ncbi:MAG: sigma-70 family RNA polymerase sigma factor [Ruminococcaceae bacterium]|nr:sigma-70 family RNA polymerase sigma factor [Oscillospiraceae bacterium]
MQDKELISLITKVKKGSDDAFEEIVERFDPLVMAVCHKFRPSFKEFGDFSDTDLKQELSLALYRACKSFNAEQDKVTFGKFAKRCLENCAVSVLRKVRSRHRKEGEAVERLSREHTFETFFADSPLREDKSAVLEVLAKALTTYEYAVFSRYIEGLSASEISSELGKDEKSVNNAVYRSKEKIKTIYKK